MISPSAPGDLLPLPRERDQVVSRIGAGGMAEVFLIRRTGPGGFEKFLALKRVRADLDHSTYGPMFLQEAKLVAALHHPNIVQVHDAGADESGLWFLMEYVHGKSVNAIIARALQRGIEIPIECAMYLIACVGRALHYAHHAESATEGRLAVIHRDVSPGNILVSFDGIVKLADFGIARGNHRRSETQDGTFKGKFGYAAPEHCRGEPLDSGSDIFSLGIVMHETIAARNLFRGESPSQIVHAVMAAPIPSLLGLRDDVPSELDDLVQHMLERDRGARIDSGAEVANRLDAIAHRYRLTATRERMAELMRSLFSSQETRLPTADTGESGERSFGAAGTGGRRSAAHLSAPGLPPALQGSAPPEPGPRPSSDSFALHAQATSRLEDGSLPELDSLLGRLPPASPAAPGPAASAPATARADTADAPAVRGVRTSVLLAATLLAAAAAVAATWFVLRGGDDLRTESGQNAPAALPPAIGGGAPVAAAADAQPAPPATATDGQTAGEAEPARGKDADGKPPSDAVADGKPPSDAVAGDKPPSDAVAGDKNAEPSRRTIKRRPTKRRPAGDPLLERDW